MNPVLTPEQRVREHYPDAYIKRPSPDKSRDYYEIWSQPPKRNSFGRFARLLAVGDTLEGAWIAAMVSNLDADTITPQQKLKNLLDTAMIGVHSLRRMAHTFRNNTLAHKELSLDATALEAAIFAVRAEIHARRIDKILGD